MNNDELKKLLEVESEECPVCRQVIRGTESDRREHKANCSRNITMVQIQQAAAKAERERQLREELEKLL